MIVLSARDVGALVVLVALASSWTTFAVMHGTGMVFTEAAAEEIRKVARKEIAARSQCPDEMSWGSHVFAWCCILAALSRVWHPADVFGAFVTAWRRARDQLMSPYVLHEAELRCRAARCDELERELEQANARNGIDADTRRLEQAIKKANERNETTDGDLERERAASASLRVANADLLARIERARGPNAPAPAVVTMGSHVEWAAESDDASFVAVPDE